MCRRRLDGHVKTKLLQTLGQGGIAVPPVIAQVGQLDAERTARVFHEVDQHMDTTTGDRHARDLAPGDQADAQLVGPHSGPSQAGQRVVVGQGHCAAADLVGQLDDPLGRIGPVGQVGVGMEIDHRCDATARV